MPRTTKRRRYLNRLQDLINFRALYSAVRVINDDDDSLEDNTDQVLLNHYEYTRKQRYLFRRSRYRKGQSLIRRFELDLKDTQDFDNDEEISSVSTEGDKLPWTNDEEFLKKYRVTRDSFGRILRKIEGHEVFKAPRGRRQAPVAHQLMVFLRYVGIVER